MMENKNKMIKAYSGHLQFPCDPIHSRQKISPSVTINQKLNLNRYKNVENNFKYFLYSRRLIVKDQQQ